MDPGQLGRAADGERGLPRPGHLRANASSCSHCGGFHTSLGQPVTVSSVSQAADGEQAEKSRVLRSPSSLHRPQMQHTALCSTSAQTLGEDEREAGPGLLWKPLPSQP